MSVAGVEEENTAKNSINLVTVYLTRQIVMFYCPGKIVMFYCLASKND